MKSKLGNLLKSKSKNDGLTVVNTLMTIKDILGDSAFNLVLKSLIEKDPELKKEAIKIAKENENKKVDELKNNESYNKTKL